MPHHKNRNYLLSDPAPKKAHLSYAGILPSVVQTGCPRAAKAGCPPVAQGRHTRACRNHRHWCDPRSDARRGARQLCHEPTTRAYHRIPGHPFDPCRRCGFHRMQRGDQHDQWASGTVRNQPLSCQKRPQGARGTRSRFDSRPRNEAVN